MFIPQTLYDPTNLLTLQFQPCPSMHQPDMKSTITDRKEILFTAKLKELPIDLITLGICNHKLIVI